MSTVFRRVLKPCLVMSGIAAALCCYNAAAPAHLTASVSLIPHTLLGAALSLLLVFRTNASFHRWAALRACVGPSVLARALACVPGSLDPSRA
jgi:predicted membrane chloride channel (bestrophin family)